MVSEELSCETNYDGRIYERTDDRLLLNCKFPKVPRLTGAKKTVMKKYYPISHPTHYI